ncbi:MAG: arylsulfatase [Candidatus Hydrogenedentes bacterium]|nr:arylsulfatase [Candidatus Hydrogenedentota bacterium]
MNRREFLKTTGAAALAAGGWGLQAFAQDAAQRPNIIFIMADDLGYGHLGCYGQEHIRTPNIDRLAKEGLRFTQAYAGAPLCAPSRSVLMTGYHSGHTPVRGNAGGIAMPDGYVTTAEVLKTAGYRTGLFGKWGLGDADTEGVPNRQGFDEFLGYLHQKHAHFYYTDYLWHNEEPYPLPGNTQGKKEQYTHDVILEKSLEFIRANRENPFFCYLSLTIPHHEWTVPEDSLDEYADAFDENPPRFKWRQGYAFPDKPKANMAAMITRMDDGVGKVMDLLQELDIDDNTLVIFTSDNGADRYSVAEPEFFEANGPLREYKGTLYEGGIRIPAIARWPKHIAAGTESAHPWYFCDVMPTFAELAGAGEAVPGGIDGKSIVPALVGADAAGREQDEHAFMYWELWGDKIQSAGRMGKWKGIYSGTDADFELYDLETDVSEQHNVAEAHPEIAAKMKSLLLLHHKDPPPQTEPNAPDGRQHR